MDDSEIMEGEHAGENSLNTPAATPGGLPVLPPVLFTYGPCFARGSLFL